METAYGVLNNLTLAGGTSQLRWDSFAAMWASVLGSALVVNAAGNHEVEAAGIDSYPSSTDVAGTYSYASGNYPFQALSHAVARSRTQPHAVPRSRTRSHAVPRSRTQAKRMDALRRMHFCGCIPLPVCRAGTVRSGHSADAELTGSGRRADAERKRLPIPCRDVAEYHIISSRLVSSRILSRLTISSSYLVVSYRIVVYLIVNALNPPASHLCLELCAGLGGTVPQWQPPDAPFPHRRPLPAAVVLAGGQPALALPPTLHPPCLRPASALPPACLHAAARSAQHPPSVRSATALSPPPIRLPSGKSVSRDTSRIPSASPPSPLCLCIRSVSAPCPFRIRPVIRSVSEPYP